MIDIFLSYVIYDTGTARVLSDLFREQGWTVWLSSPVVDPGRTLADLDKRELKGAKVIVALWSHAASESATVREDLKELSAALPVIVLLDKTEPHLPVTLPRGFDLSDWDGDPSHAGLTSLLRQLRAILDRPPASFEELSLVEIQEKARRGIQESLRSRPEADTRFKGVFISYRRNEAAAYAGRLYDRLAARFGKEKVFIDTANVGWGEDFVEAITEAAESCAAMIVLISPRWSRGRQEEVDDYVRLEVAAALGRKIRVIPILIPGAAMPAPKELPVDLSPLLRRNALEFSDTRWERDVEDLIKTLEPLL